jgi:branched-chain amino acid transport system substrate-binding protein
MSESRKIGFNPVFLGTSGSYTALMPKLGGQAVEGLYAGMTAQVPTATEGSQAAREWVGRYKARFNEDPDVFSVSGYIIIESFARAAEKAGKDLTVDNFVKAADSLTIPPDMFGAPEVKFTATQRLGSSEMRLSQIQSGKWQVISPYYK